MEDSGDDAALMTDFGATKIQSIVRMVLVRSKLLKQINARYEKIYDPKRERFYYYDRVKDESSWGKPALLLKSDIAEISPTYVEGEEGASESARLRMLQGGDGDPTGKTAVDSDLDESVEKTGEEESSDESSVDSATARERRRLKRRYPRSKAQGKVDQGEDNIAETKALDLSGLGAYRISSRIYDLAELTYLNLSDNHLGRISPNIQYFANLQQLDIHSNELPTLPKELEELQQLTFLDASRNYISTFPGRVYKLGNLEHLNLSRNPLKTLPVEVGNLELLQELGQWEVGISLLSRLQHLDVSRCLLTEWPPQINLLPELTYLDLSRNNIKVIPSELADLATLQTLLLSGNGIEELAPEIYSLMQLQILDLSRNALKALPQLPPSNLSSDSQERCLERLVDVDLSHNQLAVLDDMLGVFCRAEKLDVSHNEVQAFEGEALGKFTALRVLDLSHNELRVISSGLRACTALQHLRVMHNKLTAVPDSLSRTTKLVTIDLSHNEITDAAGKIFAMLNELRRLDLHHNRIGPLPALLFSLRHLQHLDLSHNAIPDLAEGLGALSGITHLDFSHNQVVSVPESISNLTLLKSLQLEDNRITALPSSISKLYRTLARVTVSRNNFAVSPNLLVTLPMLLTCNLSWNPNLKSQFVDWTKLSAEYKPKKAFISSPILSRRIASVVDRLDALIAEAKPPASPSSFFMSGAQAAAVAGAEPVDDELLEFQNTVQDDNSDLAASSAAALKEAKKKRSKGAKRVKQALAWQYSLREHLLAFANRPDAEGARASVIPVPLMPTATVGSQPAPVIADVAEGQKLRLNAHMHSLFKLLDRTRGGTPIGMSWQEALRNTQTDILSDAKCASVLSAMSLGSELQDSIESLQYLLNEIDALLMIQELRQLLNNYAKLMGRLRVAEKEEKALAAVSPTVKSKLTALSGAAKKFVKTANAGGNLEERDLSAVSASASRSLKVGRDAPTLPVTTREPSWVPGLIKEDEGEGEEGEVDGPSWSAEPFSEGAGDHSADRISTDELDDAGGDPLVPVKPASEKHTSAGQPAGAEATLGFEASDKTSQVGEDSRKEVAEDHLDMLARNIRASVKMRRDNNKVLEEAAKLAKSIADTIDQVQKPSLGIVYTRLPHLAFLPVAVEGVLPGMNAQNEALLPVLVDCCLHLSKALLLRADGFRDAIREIELRGGIPVSGLDVSQRRGEDFLDLMEDVHQELSRAIDLRENESAADGPKKSKSIFGKKNTASSALLEAAMAGSAPAIDSDGEEAGEVGEEEGEAGGERDEGSAAAAISSPSSKSKVARGGSSATILSEPPKQAAAPEILLSTILPRIDPDRKPIHPVDTATARRCIQSLTGHRLLTLMWTSYLLEVASGILARRGTDPQYQKFRAHTKHSYNYTPEWVTQSTGRVSQMKGRVYQGLCIYHQAVDEFAVCTKFSKNARSRPYYVNIIKLHLAQGNFMWARSVLFDALRELYSRSFPGFDLSDSTAMPDPIDVLRVDKELALLQGLIDANLAQLHSCGLFTSTHSRFNSVQENGLLSAPDRVPMEIARGLSLHAAAVLKARSSTEAEAAQKAREALESSREELKQRIQLARDRANESLNTAHQ